MPSPKKRYPYAIVRNDNTYNVYDLTKDDYKLLVDMLIEEEGHVPYVELSIGIIRVDDIRSVIEQKPEPVQKEDKPALPPMSQEERTWYNQLKEMGYFDDSEVDI